MAGSIERDERLVDAAISWQVELSSGATTEHQKRAFEAWLAADPHHEAAWDRLQNSLMPCGVAARQALPPGRLTTRILAGRPDRRAVLTGLTAALGLGTAGALVADRFVPLGDLLADHVTRTAQLGRVRFDDGSEVVLAPRTALDVDVSPGRRSVRLIEGELLLRVASRSVPFQVQAGQLSLAAGSGSFMIERRADTLAATGLQGTGQLALGPAPAETIGQGERVGFEDGRRFRQPIDVEDATAWLDGLLVAKDRSVAAIVGALQPYFPGIIRLDPAVAHIRATGVFPLRRPHEALDVLATSLNLSTASVAHYWVSIGPGASEETRPG